MKKVKRVKKIYEWQTVLVEVCRPCRGTGWNSYNHRHCTECQGQGGTWRRQRELVGEEVTE